ncbi:molybdenum ABC transporter ATP-binding protein ModC [Shewanella avicenniae]|uniref:Molybdenum ABC transporter ATP-binding protein ModC n=1 Tax=Shewanella avicenniae TaxID=2814294 RepID=A0ABX7QSW7_9GAMM|nr:molybdenum ABC transporter ATP-binding protein ModC [Shewanella avicenniae]QSX33771.1 molybdenum ABC transporter ATP-binding protein ModC [Shewanella avicenniae]
MLIIDIQKRLGDTLLEVNSALPTFGVSAIFGRSGAGKTSLVNILGGLAIPDVGRIQLGDRVLFDGQRNINLRPEQRATGFVFQDARLFPHYSVRGNLNYGRPRQPNQRLFDTVVALLGLDKLLKRYPAALSGGEKQRVAIGRALLTEPELLLMDEPLASLDLPRKQELLPYLQRMAAELKLPIVYVSHSLDEILQLADHMLVLDSGKMVLNGPLEQMWDSPLLRPWQTAQEQSSLISAKVIETVASYEMSRLALNREISLWVNQLLPQGELIRVRIHSNQVSVCRERPQASSIRNVLPVTLQGIEPSNSGQYVSLRLDLAGSVLWANITRWALDELQLKVGEQFFAQIKGVSLTSADIAAA